MQPDPNVMGAKGAGRVFPHEGGGARCILDGIMTDCSFVRGEAAQQCPNNDCRPQVRSGQTPNGQRITFLTTPFMAFANGVSGYFLPSSMGMGTPQQWADWIYLEATRGSPSANGQRDGRGGAMGGFALYFAPQQDRVDYNGHGIRPGPNPNRSAKIDDCHRFADIVARIAAQFPGNDYKDMWRFRDALWDRFNNRERSGFDYHEFSSSGFKEEYRDENGPNNSPNQVYHYVGGFRAGFSLGDLISGPVLLNHETDYETWHGIPYGVEPETPSHKADKALFKISAQHGSMVGGRGIRPIELADHIRKDVCK